MINLEAALERARWESERSPQAWEPLARQGALLVTLGRAQEGLAALERAERLAPGEASVQNNLGAALRALGRDLEALTHFETALALAPGDADAVNNAANATAALGFASHEKGDHAEAAGLFRRAIAQNPNLARAWVYLGLSLGALGEDLAATSAILRGIEIEPDAAEYYRHLAYLNRDALTLQHQNHLLALIASGLGGSESIEAHAALARTHSEDAQRSFAHMRTAAGERRKSERYDELRTLAAFTNIASFFTADRIANMRGHGFLSELPVFIFGMPRSGTTLVEQILASHPSVSGAGELSEFEDAVEAIGLGNGPRLYRIGERYNAKIARLAPGALRITDKMPLNFRFAGPIHLTLPGARMIHVRRDPADTAISLYEQQFKDVPWSYDLAEIGRFMRGYLNLMDHWRSVLPAGTMLEIDYEDLVADLETNARRLIDYAGLEWDDHCLRFYETYRPVKTASAAQVRTPIYTSSVGRAKAYGDLLKPFSDALYE